MKETNAAREKNKKKKKTGKTNKLTNAAMTGGIFFSGKGKEARIKSGDREVIIE